jgi:hypothetical protein
MWIIPFLQEGFFWRMEDPESHQRSFTRGKPRVARELGEKSFLSYSSCRRDSNLETKLNIEILGNDIATDVRVKKPKLPKKKLLKKLLKNKNCQ